MGGLKKDEFGLLKKFACTTCLAVMESLEEKSQGVFEITRTTKTGKKEVTECLKFAEDNMLVMREEGRSYALSDKGKEALRRFRDVSVLICEP